MPRYISNLTREGQHGLGIMENRKSICVKQKYWVTELGVSMVNIIIY